MPVSIFYHRYSSAMGSTEWYRPTSRASYITVKACIRSLFWPGPWGWQPSVWLSGQSSIPKSEIYCFQNLKKPTKHCSFFFIMRVFKCNKLIFYFGWWSPSISLITELLKYDRTELLAYPLLLNFTNMTGLNCYQFYLLSSQARMSY